MGSEPNVDVVRQEACERQRLKIGTWNFAGLCSERKHKEISEVLNRVKVDRVAGQETWERKDKVVKSRINPRGEEGVGFLVRECIVKEVEFIRNARYEESVWMKVRGGRGKEAFYLCCVYN